MVSLILEAIMQHVHPTEVKWRLSKCRSADVLSWKDENSFDLVHHCILQNNIVALMQLLTRGHFKSPHEPITWPYLHLVSCLGRRSFISSIIQEIKYQNDAVTLDWTIFNKAIKPMIKNCTPAVELENKDKKLSPIDVSALFGHIGCVRLLLDFWQVHRVSLSNQKLINPGALYLSLACQANSSCALQILLSEHSDKKEALEYALRLLATECVDAVLRDGVTTDVKKAFHGMNLFHVLYTYVSCLTHQQYEAMVEITSVLIKHKQDVNILKPSRTFPLYSLLCHTMSGISVEDCAPFMFSCLLLLLQAGADPNVDEVYIENKLQDPEQNTAFGRRPHSSAIHCFLSNVPFLKFNSFENPLINDPIDMYVCKVVEILIEHGADLRFSGNIQKSSSFENLTTTYHYGTALHLMLSTRTQSPLSTSLLHLILKNGVDADTKGTWDIPESTFTLKYALNILPFSLWSLQVVNQSKKYFFTSQDLEMFVYIMKFMSHGAIVESYREFLEGIQILQLLADTFDRGKLHLQDSAFFTEIMNEYEKSVRQPWLLQHCCSHVVWRACKMCMRNVNDLPIPGPLKNIVIEMN